MTGKVSVRDFVNLALSQAGDKYIFAAEASRTDPDPEAFDCSELVEWVLERLGVPDFPDGSMNQRAHCNAIPIDRAIRTRGALLFRDPSVTGTGHVAISLGNNHTIEARGSAYGVGSFDASPSARLWTSGGFIPEVNYRIEPMKPAFVDRWVVFGRFGGRWGAGISLRAIHRYIEAAEAKHGVALVVKRKEPTDLRDPKKTYPVWLAEKHKDKEAA